MQRIGLFSLFLLLACRTTYSSTFENEEGGFPQPSRLLSNALAENSQLASVGRLKAAMACTASLWRPRSTSDGPALIVTNGHCVQSYADRTSSYAVVQDQLAPSGWTVTFNDFVDTPKAQINYKVQKVIYATMSGVDLALLQLDVSWSRVSADGLVPLPQAESAADAGSPIRVIGVPQGGFADSEQFLREASCVEETTVSLVEWYWHWFDMHRNSCADIREGSSGSPVLNAQGQIYAVINTTSHGGISENCYLGNPCELQTPGAFMIAEKNYAVDITQLGQCFDSQGHFSLGKSCPLPPAETLAYSGAPYVPTRPDDRSGHPIVWQLALTSAYFQSAQWKFGRVGEIDCRESEGYSAPKGLAEAPLTASKIPDQNGVYLLCLVGQKEGGRGDFRFPTVVVLSVDTKPPSLKPELSLREQDNGIMFEPIFQVPELSGFRIGYGAAASSSCESMPLQFYRRIPVLIKKADLPAKICVEIEDNVGNRGPVFEYKAP